MYWMLNTLKTFMVMIPVLLAVAYLTLAERKVLGYIQSSKGPNMVGLYGMFQPLADGVKLFVKEMIIPNHINLLLYFISPILLLTFALLLWGFFPYSLYSSYFDTDLTMLFMLAMSNVNVYALLMSGWSSTSKYAYLGSLRAAAQMISYEVSMGLIMLPAMMFVGSLNLTKMVWFQSNTWPFMMVLLPCSVMFLMSLIAETNSAPFDLTEGESELVSGYNVEYSSMSFALLFLTEYANMMFMSGLFSLLFLSGWSFFEFNHTILLSLKTGLISMFFVWASASFPSISYDQLMFLVWKSYLPFSLGLLLFFGGMVWATGSLPVM